MADINGIVSEKKILTQAPHQVSLEDGYLQKKSSQYTAFSKRTAIFCVQQTVLNHKICLATSTTMKSVTVFRTQRSYFPTFIILILGLSGHFRTPAV
jgi:hypothetical protein